MPNRERPTLSDFTRLAAAMLAEVGMTFDDCFELGRPWLRGPEGWTFVIGRPRYAGEFRPASTRNPHVRQRPSIGITGPIDSEIMLSILAHECGHAAGRSHGGTSKPEYEEEYEAIRYGLDAMRRHLGREPHSFIVDREKKYLRSHCFARFRVMGPAPIKRWSREIVEWCGFDKSLARRHDTRLEYIEDFRPGRNGFRPADSTSEKKLV